MTWFARALGAARMRDVPAAKTAVDELQKAIDRNVQANEVYWAEQVTIQKLGASAWLALAEGRSADALAAMREAADREDRTEKSAVSPGPLAPARELLGEMLLELKQPKEALVEFKKTMAKEPNRFRALAGQRRPPRSRVTARRRAPSLLAATLSRRSARKATHPGADRSSA